MEVALAHRVVTLTPILIWQYGNQGATSVEVRVGFFAVTVMAPQDHEIAHLERVAALKKDRSAYRLTLWPLWVCATPIRVRVRVRVRAMACMGLWK